MLMQPIQVIDVLVDLARIVSVGYQSEWITDPLIFTKEIVYKFNHV